MAKANKKQTSKDVAKIASELLRDPKTSTKIKKVATSDLSQTKPDKKKKQK